MCRIPIGARLMGGRPREIGAGGLSASTSTRAYNQPLIEITNT
jgi:hypothetical protein